MVDLVELLSLEDVTWEAGKSRGWTFHEYFSGMHLYHGGRDDVGVELSGAGCRTLETCYKNRYDSDFDWLGLFRYIVDQGDEMNISRLDVAGDDKDGILTFEKLLKYTASGRFISKARRKVGNIFDEQGIIFGSPSSDTRLRIYNKALERGVDGPWIRCEFQLRDEAADSFLLNLLNEGSIGETYGGVLLNYLRYTTRPPEESCNHYDRIPTVSWWAKFVAAARKLKNIKVGGLEYNYFNLESFLVRQCASSLKTYVMANGGNVDKLLELIWSAKLSSKQEELLRQLELEKNGCHTDGAAAAGDLQQKCNT